MKKLNIYSILLIGSLLLTLPALAKTTALFSPIDKPTNKLIELIHGTKKSIHAAVYFLTDKEIAGALVEAKKRGVNVNVIVDPISTERYGKLDILAAGNIDVYIFNTKAKNYSRFDDNQRFSFLPIMHNKFALFDEKILWTGSFNWTQAANSKNAENVIICDDKDICKAYLEYWNALLKSNCSKHIIGKAYTSRLFQQNRSYGRSVRSHKSQRQAAQRVCTGYNGIQA